MKIELIKTPSSEDWMHVVNACRTTVGKKSLTKEPSVKFKRDVLKSEHSPIRLLQFHWKWTDIPSWVSVHFVRHKVGIDHFVRTQRTDRTGTDREALSQGALVEHECIANVQAIINISRKRLCNQASPETISAWILFLESFKQIEPEIYNVCVPECIYRNGLCFEFDCCNFNKTKAHQYALENYKCKGETMIKTNTRKTEFLNKYIFAKENNCTKIVIAITLDTGATELIINTENLDQKMNYYKMSYNDNLELVHNTDIKIKDFMFC